MKPGSGGSDLDALRAEARACRRCDLYKAATQTVFGEGAATARVMLVGEQPGDQEDRRGRPFVGPAGRLLDRALESAGIEWAEVYVTNVVKHFKWIPRGKRRIHQRPGAAEISACLPWLEGEIEAVAPEVVVLLGATAAQAVMGRAFRVTRDRGKRLPSPMGVTVVATVHPSSILRARDDETRDLETMRFIADLEVVAGSLT